jgi:hypothetical protein
MERQIELILGGLAVKKGNIQTLYELGWTETQIAEELSRDDTVEFSTAIEVVRDVIIELQGLNR